MIVEGEVGEVCGGGRTTHMLLFLGGLCEGIVDGKHLSARQHGKGWKRRKIDKIRDLILFDCEVLLQYCRRRSRKTLSTCLINKKVFATSTSHVNIFQHERFGQ